MITGLVAITPAAGFVNGWGAIAIGLIASTIVYFALNYLSRMRPFRNVDDTLGVVYTHGFAGLAGGLMVGLFADPNVILYKATGGGAADLPGFLSVFNGGSWELLKDQAVTALWVIGFSAIGTFILLKLIGLVVPLRMDEKDMEEGDIAVHGHEVYPSDVPSLATPGLARPRKTSLSRRPSARRRGLRLAFCYGLGISSRRGISLVAAGDVAEQVEHRHRRRRHGGAAPGRGDDRPHRGARVQGADHDVVADAGERQLRDQRDADAGRDQALDGLVVVALERDPGLEAGRVAGAHDVAGAGAGRRGLHPRLAAQVLQPRPLLGSQLVPLGQRQVHRVLEQLDPPDARAELLADAVELEEQREVELAGPQPRARSPPAPPRRG